MEEKKMLDRTGRKIAFVVIDCVAVGESLEDKTDEILQHVRRVLSP